MIQREGSKALEISQWMQMDCLSTFEDSKKVLTSDVTQQNGGSQEIQE